VVDVVAPVAAPVAAVASSVATEVAVDVAVVVTPEEAPAAVLTVAQLPRAVLDSMLPTSLPSRLSAVTRTIAPSAYRTARLPRCCTISAAVVMG
jgi:hypothetical protein